MITKEQLMATGSKVTLTKFFAVAQAEIDAGSMQADNARQAIAIRRHPNTIIGSVISKEEIQKWLDKIAAREHGVEDMMIFHGLTMIQDDSAFFFTDDYTFGTGVLPKQFVHGTHGIPLYGAGRYLSSIDDFIQIYCNRVDTNKRTPQKYLASVDELIEYVNSQYYGGGLY